MFELLDWESGLVTITLWAPDVPEGVLAVMLVVLAVLFTIHKP
jgi:hypothetical protein